MREINVEELKKIQLEILDDIHRFCIQERLTYSLAYGTLLGAIRHHGYIPWDDDIDVMMPRRDYERFINLYKSNTNEILDLRESDTTIEMFLKICRKGSIMIDTTLKRSLWGINIDVFPIDGISDDGEDHCDQIVYLRNQLPKICPFYKTIPKHKLLWFSKYLLKRVINHNYSNILTQKKMIDALACEYDLSKTNQCGCLITEDSIEMIPSNLFADFQNVLFEGKMYNSIANYDSYLTAIYGDYMRLPPIEKRITHHLYRTYITE